MMSIKTYIYRITKKDKQPFDMYFKAITRMIADSEADSYAGDGGKYEFLDAAPSKYMDEISNPMGKQYGRKYREYKKWR